ncbi:MAG: division/cell wall cluster transcriptional repressor MraZ [Oscillospiraceae bacterium]|nr:division/cell wall cluster transcriptional repressor MraZ [Oscillospiraceae bacterium]
MYIGEYYHSFDEKGRVNFPAKLREELGEQFVITKGLDGCLSAYSMTEWERMSAIVAGLPQAKARDLKRFMFSAATVVNPDKQGRVLVSPTLRAFAKITKDIAVIGASDHVELWDKEIWIERNAAMDSDDIAKAMDELGF